MKRLLSRLLIVATILSAPAFVAAQDWMSARSYYSHSPVVPIRIGPQMPYGGPYFSRVQGEYFRSGMHQIQSTIRVGPVTDRYQTWDSWGQRGIQY